MSTGKSRKKTKKPNFKSGLERRVADLLPKTVTYEPDKLKYTVIHSYTPDFKLDKNDYIEVKGRFTASDRAKHLYIKEQHPEVKIRFIFGRSQNTLNRSSKTTYADWCDKYGFEFVDIADGIPEDWIK